MQRHAVEMTRPRHARDGTARAARPRRHLLPILFVASDRRIDPASRVDDAPDERDVFLFDFAVAKLPRQLLVGLVVLGDHHQPRGAAVEAMHDPGTQLAADAAQVGHVMEERVDECAAAMAGSRMHHHSCRLVEHDDVGILEENAKRQILGHWGGRRRRGNLDRVALPGAHRRARPKRSGAAGDEAFLRPAAAPAIATDPAGPPSGSCRGACRRTRRRRQRREPWLRHQPSPLYPPPIARSQK